MNVQPEPHEAAQALAEVRRRQEQVIDMATVPTWYWWVVAGLMVVLAVGVDRKDPLSVGVGVTVFVVGMLAATARVAIRPALRAQVNNALLGARGVLAILGLAGVVVGVSLGVAFALRTAGVAMPATAGCVVGGLLMGLAGPLLSRYLRGLMLSNRVGRVR